MTNAAQNLPNPYVGPRAFSYGEKFYGRDRESRELFDLLLSERIVLLYSPSGAGKTSLIEAGLKPRLAEEGFHLYPVMRVSLTPRQLPARANRYILSLLLSLEAQTNNDAQQTPEALLQELACMKLEDYLSHNVGTEEKLQRQMLIFDQFEEVLTSDPAAHQEREEFFEQVGAVLRNRQRWALFAMREEYRAGLDPYLRPMPTRLGTTFRLDLLGKSAALEAIQRPAADVGVEFTTTAANKLVDDLSKVLVQLPEGNSSEAPGQYVEPVQLQVVCLSLWEKWSSLQWPTPKIEAEMLTQVGNVDTALADYFSTKVQAVAQQTNVSERKVRDWFHNCLITKSGIRGQILEETISEAGLNTETIQFLDKAHLIRPEVRRNIRWYELSHDRLVKPVQGNNELWFHSHLSLLQRRAEVWQAQGKTETLLLCGSEFRQEEQWASQNEKDLSENDQEFLKECQRVQEKQLVEQELIESEKRRKTYKEYAIALTALLIFSGLIAWLLYVSNQKAADQKNLTELKLTKVDLEIAKAKVDQEKKNFEEKYQVSESLEKTNLLLLGGRGKAELEEFDAASSAMKTLLKSTPPAERLKTRVLYYYKPIDGEIVERAISSLNFGFEKRPSELEAYKTSLLWFGDGVPLDHVKLLALTLVRSNIRLRFIRPYSMQKYEDSTSLNDLHHVISVGGGLDKDIQEYEFPSRITVDAIVKMDEKGLAKK